MKLNDVIILRNTDLKRFFDFPAFWSRRFEFLHMAKPGGVIDPYFFDSNEECMAGAVVCSWIEAAGRPDRFVSRIEEGAVRLVVGREELIQLNEPLREINGRLQGLNIPKMHITGLISLLKMLGADEPLSHMAINASEYLRVLKIGEPDFSEAYIPLASNATILQCTRECFPLVAKPIVNISQTPIRLTHGGRVVTLAPGQCIVGIFHDDRCYKLLPNTAPITDGRVEIMYNSLTQQTDLEIVTSDNRTRIEGVVSFFCDEFGYIYIRSDGTCRINPRTHLQIFSALQHLSLRNGERIIAIDCNNTITRIITTLKIY